MSKDPNLYKLVSNRLPVYLLEKVEAARLKTLPLINKQEYMAYLLRRGLEKVGR
jgi:hypothetical protein